MFGVCLIDKPQDFTSHDIIAILRGRFKTKRIGHAGTLDPLATGLLVVAVGPATRFLQYLPLEPKVYVATVRFGATTTSFDGEGDITSEAEVPGDLDVRLQLAIPQFLGLIDQLPPMFSAVKVKGKALYTYAREGLDVDRATRRIHIARIDVISIESDEAVLEVECSGGTYIRTLADDLGKAVGCGAYLSGLVRTQVGKFLLEDAKQVREAELTDLIPLREALAPMPMRELSQVELMRVRNGGSVANTDIEANFAGLLDDRGNVLSVASVHGNVLRPECVIPAEAFDDAV
jgi:tRNA pseudouridine55 synthase